MAAILGLVGVIGLVIFLMFFSSILVWLLWNWLAPVYLSFLPSVYLDIPFWHVWGILVVVSLLSHCVFAGVKKPFEASKD